MKTAVFLAMAGYLTARAGLVVQSIGVLNIRRLAGLAHSQIQLVVSGNVLKEIPGPFKAELRYPVQQQISFKSTTYAVTIFYVRARPTGMNPVSGIDSEQEACTKKRDQRRCLQLIVRILDEETYLLGRFSATPSDCAGAPVAEVSCVKFADPVVTEAGAHLDSACPGLVPNHSKREFELTSFGRIAVVSEAHLFLFVLVNAHIQCYKSLYHLYMVNQSKIA